MSRSGDYFFELLAEEIPAWMLDARLEQLTGDLQLICTKFVGESANAPKIIVGATSRRIFFTIRSLPSQQQERTEEIKGPSARIAWDAEGRPTPALLGFLRKNQLRESDVARPATAEEHVRVTRRVPGLGAREYLASEIPRVIETLRWPKVMRWSEGKLTFIRPVHSIVSVYDGEVVPFDLLGVTAGSLTEGHRILSRGSVEVRSFEEYESKLAERQVVIAAERRIEQMRESSRTLAREVDGVPADDASIWQQWKYLTEAAGVVRSSFDQDFLTLPEEVLVTVMRVHQKQLPILREGKISHHFLSAMDNLEDSDGNASTGNAFVTNARFADARFFYQNDRKTKLTDRNKQLKHLQFHEKLGDYSDKQRRIEALVAAIAAEGNADGDHAAVAASICKADLVTEMVKEFTDLQGQIGGIYAREEGYPTQVWQAIYDHYRPVGMEDSLPRGESGAIVSLADKLDTLCGFFLAGVRPSGSKDPFGLRRTAQGIVQLLLNNSSWQLNVSIERLIGLAIGGYPTLSGSTAGEVLEFLEERVRTLLQHPMFGFAYDEVDAAIAAGWYESLPDLFDRLSALRALRDQPQFISILDSAKRITNITGGVAESEFRGDLGHPTADRLSTLTDLVAEHVRELIGMREYRAALESFAGLAPELETFFKDVMVMVDEPETRQARLALLRRVGSLVSSIADVTKIVVNRRDYDPHAA